MIKPVSVGFEYHVVHFNKCIKTPERLEKMAKMEEGGNTTELDAVLRSHIVKH